MWMGKVSILLLAVLNELHTAATNKTAFMAHVLRDMVEAENVSTTSPFSVTTLSNESTTIDFLSSTTAAFMAHVLRDMVEAENVPTTSPFSVTTLSNESTTIDFLSSTTGSSKPKLKLLSETSMFLCGGNYMLQPNEEIQLVFDFPNMTRENLRNAGVIFTFKLMEEPKPEQEWWTCSVLFSHCDQKDRNVNHCFCDSKDYLYVTLNAGMGISGKTLQLTSNKGNLYKKELPRVKYANKLHLVHKGAKFLCDGKAMLAGAENFTVKVRPEPYSLDHLQQKNGQVTFIWGDQKSCTVMYSRCSKKGTPCGCDSRMATLTFPAYSKFKGSERLLSIKASVGTLVIDPLTVQIPRAEAVVGVADVSRSYGRSDVITRSHEATALILLSLVASIIGANRWACAV